MRGGQLFRIGVLAALTAIYTAPRICGLTSSCLWFDEIFSVHASTHSWDSILGFIAQDLIHPPLFYIFLKIWMYLGGDGLLWLRLFSVLLSLAALPISLLLCRELRIRFAASALALFFLSVNGALIKYAQEVRMYSLLMLLASISAWLLARYLNGRDRIWILTLVNLLLVYTHYFGWFVILSELILVILWRRRSVLTMFGMTAVVFGAFLPWAIAVALNTTRSAGFEQNIGWMSRPGPLEIGQFLIDLIEPFYSQPASTFPTSIFVVTLPLTMIVLVAFVIFFISGKRSGEDERFSIKYLVTFAAAPVVTALILSWLLPYSIWGTRHLIIVFAPSLLLLAYCLTKLELRAVQIVIVIAIVGVAAAALALQVQRPDPQFAWCVLGEMVVQRSSDHRGSQAPKVGAFEDLIAYQLWFELRNEHPPVEVVKITGTGEVTEDAAFFLPRGFEEIRSLPIDGISDESMVVAFRRRDWADASPIVEAFAARGYVISDREERQAEGEKAFFVTFERQR